MEYYYNILSKYYDVDKPYAFFMYGVRFSVNHISRQENANGFIVQKVKISTNLILQKLRNIEYFEAWKVINGKIEDELGCDYDDLFGYGQEILIQDALKESLNKKGFINYSSELFWVDKSNYIYSEVDKWEIGTVTEAKNLRSILASDFKKEKDLHFVTKREEVNHIVDFIDKGIVKRNIIDLFNSRLEANDKELFSIFENLFSSTEYYELSQEILKEYNIK